MNKNFKRFFATLLIFSTTLLAGCYQEHNALTENKKEQESKQTEQVAKKLVKEVNCNHKKHNQKKSAKQNINSKSVTELASLNYDGKNEITVNNNNPKFSQEDLSSNTGPWQNYGPLDNLNRATAANALLNKSLMPTEKRESLYWNPTGWHNKRIKSGWLYNRSHLIGYQLTGQNNNPKNLITGTRQLNAPEMLAHEDDIAYYIKQNPDHYVRYRVTPVFRGDELLARGVQMEAQSIGDNQIHFNVYIFNVEDGVKLNYSDGTSVVNN